MLSLVFLWNWWVRLFSIFIFLLKQGSFPGDSRHRGISLSLHYHFFLWCQAPWARKRRASASSVCCEEMLGASVSLPSPSSASLEGASISWSVGKKTSALFEIEFHPIVFPLMGRNGQHLLQMSSKAYKKCSEGIWLIFTMTQGASRSSPKSNLFPECKSVVCWKLSGSTNEHHQSRLLDISLKVAYPH